MCRFGPRVASLRSGSLSRGSHAGVGRVRVEIHALRVDLRCRGSLEDLARRLLTGSEETSSRRDEVMMRKRFKLGFTLCGLIGVAIFGTSSKRAVSVAWAESTGSSASAAMDSAKGAPNGAIHASLGAKLSATPRVEPESRCAPGMAEVEGDYCSSVEQKCLRWLDPETKQRCAEFAPTSACKGRTEHKHFCVDRYEYPNVEGEKPVVMRTWVEAKMTCESEGKRLCGE